MHAHYGPDPKGKDRVNALEGARLAQDAGMRAIVLKNHSYSTAPLAQIINQIVPNIEVVGGIALNLQMVVATGHILVAEAFALVREARKRGLSRRFC